MKHFHVLLEAVSNRSLYLFLARRRRSSLAVAGLLSRWGALGEAAEADAVGCLCKIRKSYASRTVKRRKRRAPILERSLAGRFRFRTLKRTKARGPGRGVYAARRCQAGWEFLRHPTTG